MAGACGVSCPCQTRAKPAPIILSPGAWHVGDSKKKKRKEEEEKIPVARLCHLTYQSPKYSATNNFNIKKRKNIHIESTQNIIYSLPERRGKLRYKFESSTISLIRRTVDQSSIAGNRHILPVATRLDRVHPLRCTALLANSECLPAGGGCTSSIQRILSALISSDVLTRGLELKRACVGDICTLEDASLVARVRRRYETAVGARCGNKLSRRSYLDFKVAMWVLWQSTADGLPALVGSCADKMQLVGESVSRTCFQVLVIQLCNR